MKKNLLFAVLLGMCLTLLGQEKILKYESHLVLDNDLFTGNLYLDQYYSSGIYPAFRWLADSTDRAKRIRTITFHHRMYTPELISTQNPRLRDRPYAGIISFSGSNEYYFENETYALARLELGWMGPHSGVDNIQKTYHKWFNLTPPHGWNEQIQDSPVITVELSGIKPGPKIREFDLAHQGTVQFGTVFNFIRYDAIIRGGILRPYHKSVFTNAVLGSKRTPKTKLPLEAFFFYSPGLELVIYNATLQGNLIGVNSPFTVEPNRLIWQQRVGFMASWAVMDFGVTAYWRRRENVEAGTHNYVGLLYNHRF